MTAHRGDAMAASLVSRGGRRLLGWVGGGRRHLGGQSGQALPMVLGLVTMITMGTVVMVQNVSQHFTIVQRDVVQHEAYRAMQAGLSEYLNEADSNPDYIVCNATFWQGTPSSWTSLGSPSLPSGLCNGLAVNSWISVPNLASTLGAPAWFSFGNPKVYICNGNSTQCPTSVWENITVVGAAGYPNLLSYNTGTISIQPSNSFLLNLWWLNYDQEDPEQVNAQNPPTCTYYWENNYALMPNCVPVDFVTGESLLGGNIFSNDSIFVCGSPNLNGSTITTADPKSGTEVDPDNGGCSNTPQGTYTSVTGQKQQQIPTDDAVLNTVASEGGCLYEGPTEIDLAKNGNTWEMDVYSPDTPSGSGGTGDGLNNSQNSNTCLPNSPKTTMGWEPYPSNGVIFVENCPSTSTTCSSTTYNPLNGLDQPDDYGPQGPTEGDAIVQGTVSGPLTIAAQDNVVITGNLCYASWTSCTTPPSSAETDVLGLIAYNYVEINHPMSSQHGGGWVNDSNCTNNLAPMGPNTTPDCDLSNPIFDTAILALNQQFFANNFDQGSSLGTVSLYGTLDEDWRGPVGTQGGGGNTGYLKQYTYDTRLRYLSPPHYLNPGTASWTLASVNTSSGSCPSGFAACSTVP